MNRRAVLAAAPAAVAVPAFAARPEASPIMALFREWQVLRAEENRLYDIGACVTVKDAATARVSPKEAELRAVTAASPLEWIAKAAAIADFGIWCLDERQHKDLWDEARALLGASGFMVAS